MIRCATPYVMKFYEHWYELTTPYRWDVIMKPLSKEVDEYDD